MEIATLFMIVGFLLAAYSIIANDAIQTIGTFISSNAHRPWWVLWIFIASVLTAVLFYGWYANGGDPSYGRLEKFPVPDVFSWIYVLPPLSVLVLTRFGIPVSTTFIVLTVFAPTVLTSMLTKSLLGYMVAFITALIVYRFVTARVEKHFIQCQKEEIAPADYWIVLQWMSTGFLWSQWLIQDLANIFVYMPARTISIELLLASLSVLIIMLGVILYQKGGAIQHIVSTKTNTMDIRSATIIDFIYGLILLVFKEYSSIPMSTTWVFIGLLAGREFAIAYYIRHKHRKKTVRIVLRDITKATIGLIVSIFLALLIPTLA